jgi:hypothetical protein
LLLLNTKPREQAENLLDFSCAKETGAARENDQFLTNSVLWAMVGFRSKESKKINSKVLCEKTTGCKSVTNMKGLRVGK